MIGITSTQSTGQSYELGASANDWAYTEDGNKYTSGSGTAYGSTYTSGDIIGVAMDLDNNKLYFLKMEYGKIVEYLHQVLQELVLLQ